MPSRNKRVLKSENFEVWLVSSLLPNGFQYLSPSMTKDGDTLIVSAEVHYHEYKMRSKGLHLRWRRAPGKPPVSAWCEVTSYTALGTSQYLEGRTFMYEHDGPSQARSTDDDGFGEEEFVKRGGLRRPKDVPGITVQGMGSVTLSFYRSNNMSNLSSRDRGGWGGDIDYDEEDPWEVFRFNFIRHPNVKIPRPAAVKQIESKQQVRRTRNSLGGRPEPSTTAPERRDKNSLRFDAIKAKIDAAKRPKLKDFEDLLAIQRKRVEERRKELNWEGPIQGRDPEADTS